MSSRGRATTLFKDLALPLWAYRGFILASVRREFMIRYRSSVLGSLWSFLNPLAMIVVYTVIFSQIMHARLPGVESNLAYSIYLCAGILTWGLHSEILSRSVTVFLEHANMIKKLSFPKISLPAIVLLNALINFSIIFGIFLVFLVLAGALPGLPLLALPLLLLLQISFAVSLGLILGLLNVFFRDVGQVVGIVLQFWFWLTPIVYPLSIVPESLQSWIWLNPMTALVTAYQGVLVFDRWPEWSTLQPLLIITLICVVVGLQMFRKRSPEMVDEL